MSVRQAGRLHSSFQRPGLPNPVPYYTPLPCSPSQPPPLGLKCPSRSLLDPSPARGDKPTHLPAPPRVRTASCPSFAWAGAPRSYLRLLLQAPAVGITPARLQPAVPRTASRGGLEARTSPLQIPLATTALPGHFFLQAWPPTSCWGLGRGRGACFLLPKALCNPHTWSLQISKPHPCIYHPPGWSFAGFQGTKFYPEALCRGLSRGVMFVSRAVPKDLGGSKPLH